MTARTTVILGCGYTGLEVALQTIRDGERVIATTRSAVRVAELAALGIEARVIAGPTDPALSEIDFTNASVLIAFQPDGSTDRELLPIVRNSAQITYISTTGVYGSARGHVDEQTPIERDAKTSARIDAEDIWRSVGAVILRPAGIYGPGRGLHLRIARGDFRLTADGAQVVSRVHVSDLAAMIRTCFQRAQPGATFVVADDAPVPQIEAVRWLCDRLDKPLPPSISLEEAHETLRHDRRVDNRQIKSSLDFRLRYPTYREGFAACIEADRLISNI